MQIKKLLVSFVVCAIAVSGWAGEPVDAFTRAYLQSQKDGIIKNWQAQVIDLPKCNKFKDDFRVVSDRHNDAANGAFQQDVQRVWQDVIRAGCNEKDYWRARRLKGSL